MDNLKPSINNWKNNKPAKIRSLKQCWALTNNNNMINL